MQFNPPDINSSHLDDEKERRKILEYLYQLTEQLRFTLNNLDEENLSDDLVKIIRDSGGSEEMASAIEQTSQAIAMKVSKGKVISEINQTAELVKIAASKIALEGVVTANEKFRILLDGSMEANDGTFAGILAAQQGSVGAATFGTDGMSIKGDLSVSGAFPKTPVTPQNAGFAAADIGDNVMVLAGSLSAFKGRRFTTINVTDGKGNYWALPCLGTSVITPVTPDDGGGGSTIYQVIQLKSTYGHSSVTIRNQPSGTNIGSLAREGWAITTGNVGNSWWHITGLCSYSGSGNNGTISNVTAIDGYVQIGAGSVNGPFTTSVVQ